MAGAIQHVYGRANRKALLFLDDVDREGYLSLLGRVVVRQGWRCLSYCLMDTHMHMLIETPEANLSRGMQRLHGDFARGFNRRHAGSGHVFQGRFGSRRATSDEHLWTIAAYIAGNPVEAGMCASPEQWPWSSHAFAAGAGGGPRWLDLARLYSLFDAWGGDPRERYLDAVAGRAAAAVAGRAAAAVAGRAVAAPVAGRAAAVAGRAAA